MHRLLPIKVLPVALLATLLYWGGEALLHVYLEPDLSYLEHLLHPDRHELWMRLLFVAAILLLSTLIHYLSRGIRKSQYDLVETTAFLSSVFETANDAIIIINPRGLIQFYNPAAEKLFGYALEEVSGQNVRMLMPAPHRQQHDHYLENYLTTGQPKIIGIGREVSGRHKDGREFPLYLSVSRTMAGEQLFFTGILHDLSAAKAAETQLRQALVTAGLADRAKNNFISSMTHELRTPLNAVLGFAQLLKEGVLGPLSDQQQEAVADILESGRSLLAHIEEIISLADYRADLSQGHLRDTPLKPLLEKSAAALQEQALRAGVALQLELPPPLTELIINTDPQVLKQVLFSLLENGIKFNHRGGSVRVGVALHGQALWISVSDSGIGLAPEQLEAIFQPFHQLQGGLTDKTAGTGIGLALVQRQVHLLGGRVWAESGGPEQGSTFIVELPLAAGE